MIGREFISKMDSITACIDQGNHFNLSNATVKSWIVISDFFNELESISLPSDFFWKKRKLMNKFFDCEHFLFHFEHFLSWIHANKNNNN